MNKEYLLTPVIEVQDGNELKSFQVRYIFIIAFLFGLLPTLVLCIRNCLWLRVERKVIILMFVISILVLVSKFLVLGFYYHTNIEQFANIRNVPMQSNSQEILENSQNANLSEETNQSQEISSWDIFKSNVSMFERIYSLLLLFTAYQLFRSNYRVVLHLTGSLQPMFKWALISIIAAVLFESLMSQLFFGGNL